MSDIFLNIPIGLSGTSYPDLSFDIQGRLNLVSSSDNLQQFITKILLSDKSNVSIDPTYGTLLSTFIGTTPTDSSLELMQQSIISALGYVVTQYENSLDLSEQIGTLQSITTTLGQDANSQVTINFLLSIVLNSGKAIEVNVMV